MSSGLFYHSLFIDMGVSLSLDPTHWLDWLATKSSELSCLCLTSLGLQSHSSTLAFLCVDSGAFEQRSFYLQTLSLSQPWSLFVISA